MPTLRLGPILDEKPVRISAELPASVYRDLLAFTEVLGRETGRTFEPAQLVVPMISRFMETDRGFAKARRRLVASHSASIKEPSDAPPPVHVPRSESI